MSDQMQPINVEEIMREIRQQIADRGVTEEIPNMADALVDENHGVLYNYRELQQLIMQADEEHNIPYYQTIPQGGLKALVKKVIRKIIAFVVLPLRDGQNRFNSYIVQALRQILAYMEKQDQTLVCMKNEGKELLNEQRGMLVMQEEDLENIVRRISELEKKYEALIEEKG